MSEAILAIPYLVAFLLFVDPFFNGRLTQSGFGKGALLILLVSTALFHLLGCSVFNRKRTLASIQQALAAWWPIVLLGAMIVSGSIYAKKVLNIDETFLHMGTPMFLLPLVSASILAAKRPSMLFWTVGFGYVMAALGMIATIIATRRVYHEEIFLVIPLGAALLVQPKLKLWQVILGSFLYVGCLFSFKNTTFILTATTFLVIGYIHLSRFLKNEVDLYRFTIIYTLLGVLCMAVAAALYYYFEYRSRLPSGSPEYRLEMYGIAIRKFLSSPLWGGLFTGPAVEYFSLYQIDLGTQYLPTHSDILDILANGGMIALVLWGSVVFKVLKAFREIVKATGQLNEHSSSGARLVVGMLLVLSLIQICAIVTYAFNPPLVNPIHGFFIWGGIGFMWASLQLAKQNGYVVPTVSEGSPRRG